MKRLVLAVVVLLSCPALRAAADAYQDARVAYAQTNDRVQYKASLQEITKASPRMAAAHFDLGVLAEAEEDWSLAATSFHRYLKLAPRGKDAARATAELKKLRKIQERYPADQAAERRYRSALQLGRRFLFARLLRAADASLEEAAQLKPDGWEAYSLAAISKLEQRDFDQADALLMKAIAVAPDAEATKLIDARSKARDERFFVTALAEANAASDKKDFATAAGAVGKALKLKPEHKELLLSKATFLIRARRYADARDVLKTMAATNDKKLQQQAAALSKTLDDSKL